MRGVKGISEAFQPIHEGRHRSGGHGDILKVRRSAPYRGMTTIDAEDEAQLYKTRRPYVMDSAGGSRFRLQTLLRLERLIVASPHQPLHITGSRRGLPVRYHQPIRNGPSTGRAWQTPRLRQFACRRCLQRSNNRQMLNAVDSLFTRGLDRGRSFETGLLFPWKFPTLTARTSVPTGCALVARSELVRTASTARATESNFHTKPRYTKKSNPLSSSANAL